LQTFQQVRTELKTNPEDYTDGLDTILSIVQAGEDICQSLAAGNTPVPLDVPAETATGAATEAAIATEVATEISGVLPSATTTPTP
jgi:hypothetical protein